MREAPPKGGYLGQARLVILLALVYGGALAGVETTLRGKIEDNKLAETFDKIPDLVPGADKDRTARFNKKNELTVTDEDGNRQRVYAAVDADGAHQGWVLPAAGLGFADRIELLVGLDSDVSTITGLWVLDQKETPGLGNFITSPELFLNQFCEKSAEEELVVVKIDARTGSNEIRALTGATISSESVATIVNRAIAQWKEPIRQLELPPAEPDGSSSDGGG